jgi:hypothetical protein
MVLYLTGGNDDVYGVEPDGVIYFTDPLVEDAARFRVTIQNSIDLNGENSEKHV